MINDSLWNEKSTEVQSASASDSASSLFLQTMQQASFLKTTLPVLDKNTNPSIERTSFMMPRLAPHPSPWGGGSDTPSTPAPPADNGNPPWRTSPRPVPVPQTPTDKGGTPPWRTTPTPAPSSPSDGGGPWGNSNGDSSRPAPTQPSDGPWSGSSSGDSQRPAPTPSDGPWDKIPGSPWQRGGSDSAGRTGDRTNPPRPQGGGSADEASRAFDRDRVQRTSESFYNSADAFRRLGNQNEVALEMKMRDWLQQKNSLNPITFMRGTAAIATGLGQFRLEAGSRIDITSHADSKPRILQGEGYDFGGEATTWLRLAAGSLVEAQQYVRGHKGLVIDGQPMDDAYIQQLKGLQTNVEGYLNQIYGPHNIDSIYNTLLNEVRVNSGDWQQGLVRLHQQFNDTKSNDNRFMAKSARDVALGFLAEAGYMSSRDNGEEAKIMFKEANDLLATSQRLDGSAPDNLALAQISNRLRAQINKAIDNQWSDPFGNPFNIPKPQNSLIA